MRKTLFAIAAVCACAVAVTAAGQPISVDRKQVSVAAARKMVDACIAFAEKHHANVAVAVVDFSGVLVDFHRMEGGGPTTAETAILKAKTAAHWQRSTTTLENNVTHGGNQAPLWVGDFPKGGAFPILIDGQVAGAIGVGGPMLQDECAQAGLDAVLPKAPASAARGG